MHSCHLWSLSWLGSFVLYQLVESYYERVQNFNKWLFLHLLRWCYEFYPSFCQCSVLHLLRFVWWTILASQGCILHDLDVDSLNMLLNFICQYFLYLYIYWGYWYVIFFFFLYRPHQLLCQFKVGLMMILAEFSHLQLSGRVIINFCWVEFTNCTSCLLEFTNEAT